MLFQGSVLKQEELDREGERDGVERGREREEEVG